MQKFYDLQQNILSLNGFRKPLGCSWRKNSAMHLIRMEYMEQTEGAACSRQDLCIRLFSGGIPG